MNIDLNKLKKLSTSKNALNMGKAAEHLVCASLILNGYQAYLSDQGLPYDILIDLGDKILRVQVKATGFPKNVNATGRTERLAYCFHVRRRGRNAQGSRLDKTMCDIVAVVGLSDLAIGYFPIEFCGQTIQVLPDGEKTKQLNQGKDWGCISSFTITAALEKDRSVYGRKGGFGTHCIRGHKFTKDTTKVNKTGSRSCRICLSENQKKHNLKKRSIK